MALYALGDPHLSLGTQKPMDVFGGSWENYIEKLEEGLGKLSDRDTLILAGDISWGMSLEESAPDFKFLDRFPGKKLILKGNHDYWWSTVTKMKAFFDREGIKNLDFLHNNCHYYGEFALCGTRGWFYEEERGGEHDRKMLSRELIRLEASLKEAGGRRKLVFLHYPPRHASYTCTEIVELMERYGVERCYSGHIHSFGLRRLVQGKFGGIEYRNISADYLEFEPLRLAD